MVLAVQGPSRGTRVARGDFVHCIRTAWGFDNYVHLDWLQLETQALPRRC